ncbi:hypothetical protein CTAYLR_004449 [Chrysophaeum taylorii]|uniref:CSC1/OSCA1-like cytosolic domain-containing protein n=1 Tax=Chrysophaeum taylorii TaxID=2483200 RepID=A0AAD7UCK0_9STRA|nr:hypothetical protein CTAYLR_004449 [Chrysophaeum taylorii]
MNVGSQRRGLASTVAMVPTLSFRALRTESASTLIKQFQQEEAAVVDNEVPEESGPSTPQGGPILERLEDLLAETAIYAVGDDQKAAVWKPPSLQIALEERRRSLWREGKAALETPLRAMGEMGIGIELYFFLMREVAKLFTALTVLHLPAMLLNARTFECTGDFRISSCYASSSSSRSFFIPRMSLGDACPSGVKRMFGVIEPSPKALGMVYCVVQLATALLVIVFTIDMHRHMSERLNELQLQHAQVSQFSVLVTNLPPDTDEPELVRHFHRRYDLSRPQVAYPIYGLDVRGTALLSGILGGSAAFVVQLIAAAILRARYPVMGRKAFWSMSVSNAFVFAAIIGVPPLKEEHAMMRSRREKQLLGMLGRRRRRKNANAAAAPWRRVPKASTLWMMRSPSPKSVKDIEHLRVVPRLNHNGHRKNHARYLDKWVADVAMIRSNGELIRQYMDLRNLWGQVQCSRASVRRWSEHYGPVPNMHRCRTALNRLELLVERMKDAQRELSRSVDRKGIDETTGAFVTFEHEWSAYRCVQDYAHSRSSLLRNYFQPINLRLHRKKRISSSQKNLARTTSKSNDEFAVETDSPHFHTTSLPIAVKAAASPDDVLWENLGVPGRVKNVRRLTTILLSGVLLAFTSAVVRAKIVARARVTIPTERGCREALAMHLGYYPSNSTCDLIDMLYANASFACPGSKNFLGLRGVHYARVDDTDPDCRGDCAVCRVFLRERVIVKWVDRLLIVVIVLVNFLLELIFSLFSKFERHNSVSSSLVNTAVKTFLLSFLNTAMLVPLYNMQCSNQDAWAQFGLSWFCRYVLLGSHSGFSRTWYSEVGTTIVQTVVLNMVVNIISRLYMVLIQDPLLNWFQIDSCVTQNQLNKLLQPRRFDIDHRYSFAFTYILCTLVYCAGLPMLIPLSAAYFWTSYFVDRYLVLRRYKQPPSYDAKLSKLLLKLLPAAAVSHLFMASFMLSNQNIVVSGSIDDWRQRVWLAAWYVDFVSHILGSSSARSLSRICVAPLFVTALTAVAYKVLVVLSDVYNPELLPIPFFHTARRTRRYLERCVAADDHLDSPNTPARASELMDVVLEKRLLETVGGACSAITNIGTHIKNLSHMESATLTPSRRNRLKQSFTIGFWRHRYPRKVKPEESGHDETPKSPDQNQQQEQPRYKRLLEKVLVSTIRSSNGGRHDLHAATRSDVRSWTEDNAIDAIDAGWRKVHEKNLSSKTIDESEAHVVEDTDTLLLPNTPSKVKTMLSSPRAAGVVELERVHIEGHRKGKVMRTWEIIVAERRLSSYDIISNPNYRLALEFLESVGTFRPKRELVKDIGIFKEQLVRLNDRVRRQAMERALSQKLQSMRVERFRRRELCRAVCDRLVQHVELREAQRSVRQSQRTLALAVKARVRAEARVVLEACCAKVEQIAALNAHRAACRAVTLLRAKRDREAVAGTLDTCVAAVELRFVHKRSRQLRELASSTEVAAVVASCVGQVEARIAGDEASRLRKERDRMRRKLKRHTSAPAAAQRTEQPRQNERLDVLERALEESKALTASYARMAEHQFAMLHAAPPATTPAPESEAPRTPPHIRERIRALELECAEARRTAQAAQAAQTVHQTQATQPFITTKRKELSPRTCAAVKSASEAERVASAALGERDAAIAACKAQRYRALEERDCAVLQSHEAERLALAAYAESRAAEEEQKRAAAEAREALALAAAASEEAETARREREAAIFEARESARLVEFAAAEAARADAQHAEAVATIDVRDEARDATARQLATTLDAAAVVANAAVRERDVVEACASMTKDALRAAEAAALAAMRHAERHEASAAELEARLVATTRDLGKQLESLQRRASEQATRIDAETSRHESEQAAARATLANHAADLDAQRQARARAELELVQVRKRLELEYDAEVAKMRRAKADAQARADHATREANRASTDVEIASARIANLSADRDAAHRANADAQQRLLETQNLLHAALNRLPAHELDTILAGASVSRGHLPFDALPARASILATAPPPNQTTSSVSLKHPSHLAAALHGPPKVIAPDVSDPPPPDASSSSSSRQGGGVVFLQHTGHDRRREPTAFDSAAWGSGWFPGSQ